MLDLLIKSKSNFWVTYLKTSFFHFKHFSKPIHQAKTSPVFLYYNHFYWSK